MSLLNGLQLFILFFSYTIQLQMSSIQLSLANEKIIHQIKYLLSQPPNQVKEELLQTINKIFPFTLYPLTTPPPAQLFQEEFIENYIVQKAKSQSFAIEQNEKVIVQDLKKDLQSYCYIMLRGYMIIQKGSHVMHQQKFISQSIKEKMVFNIDEGKTVMKVSKSGVYLKIHSIWLKMAINKIKQKQKAYIKEKLLQVPFFANLTFDQFSSCCRKAYIVTLGPGDILLNQCKIPYNMNIVAEGELCLQKRVKFSKQQSVWKQVQNQLQKNNQFCQELYEYLVRQPSDKDKYFEVDFLIKEISSGEIICAKQTLNQSPLRYTIRSTLKTKIISIKYPDLYVLNQERLADIRTWPSPQIDQKRLRKQYYFQINWQKFKEYVKQQNNLIRLQRESFDEYLRKDVNLVQQRYSYYPNKVGDGKITSSPAGKILKMKEYSETDLIK